LQNQDLMLVVNPMEGLIDEFRLMISGNSRAITGLYELIEKKTLLRHSTVNPVIYVLNIILSRGEVQKTILNKGNLQLNIVFKISQVNKFSFINAGFSVVKNNLQRTESSNGGLIFTHNNFCSGCVNLLDPVVAEIRKTKDCKDGFVGAQRQIFFSMRE